MTTTTVENIPLFSQTELKDPSKSVLNALCRCDSCGSQAYIRARLKSGNTLLFCRHHGRKHYKAMEPLLSEWYSEEVLLEENRLIGSEN